VNVRLFVYRKSQLIDHLLSSLLVNYAGDRRQHLTVLAALFLKDLTFIEDGNPDYLDAEKRIINFAKNRMICAVYRQMQRFQVSWIPSLASQTPTHTHTQTPNTNHKNKNQNTEIRWTWNERADGHRRTEVTISL
jgi:hypothetical protein